jgi:thioredoxin reductase (NADPH)
VIILGGGPAGLTAGIYTSRHGLKTLLIDANELGGKAKEAHSIENFPGFPDGVKGKELMERFIAQAERFGVLFKSESIIGLMDLGDYKMITTRQGTYTGRTIIIATGIQRKKLSIPGEDEFKGLGVSYCVICDGPFFKDKNVVIIGAGHDAVEDTLRLADTAKRVYVIPGLDGFKEDYSELAVIKKHETIKILEGLYVKVINGEDMVTQIELNNGETINVDGVFIVLDQVPTGRVLIDAGIATDKSGCIIVDRKQHTNLEGIFAAGDCTCGGMQVITAAGEGGQAALEALKYVKISKKASLSA